MNPNNNKTPSGGNKNHKMAAIQPEASNEEMSEMIRTIMADLSNTRAHQIRNSQVERHRPADARKLAENRRANMRGTDESEFAEKKHEAISAWTNFVLTENPDAVIDPTAGQSHRARFDDLGTHFERPIRGDHHGRGGNSGRGGRGRAAAGRGSSRLLVTTGNVIVSGGSRNQRDLSKLDPKLRESLEEAMEFQASTTRAARNSGSGGQRVRGRQPAPAMRQVQRGPDPRSIAAMVAAKPISTPVLAPRLASTADFAARFMSSRHAKTDSINEPTKKVAKEDVKIAVDASGPIQDAAPAPASPLLVDTSVLPIAAPAVIGSALLEASSPAHEQLPVPIIPAATSLADNELTSLPALIRQQLAEIAELRKRVADLEIANANTARPVNNYKVPAGVGWLNVELAQARAAVASQYSEANIALENTRIDERNNLDNSNEVSEDIIQLPVDDAEVLAPITLAVNDLASSTPVEATQPIASQRPDSAIIVSPVAAAAVAADVVDEPVAAVSPSASTVPTAAAPRPILLGLAASLWGPVAGSAPATTAANDTLPPIRQRQRRQNPNRPYHTGRVQRTLPEWLLNQLAAEEAEKNAAIKKEEESEEEL